MIPVIESFTSWIKAYCNGRRISLLQRLELKKAFLSGWVAGIARSRKISNKYSESIARDIIEKELDESVEQLQKELNSYNQN